MAGLGQSEVGVLAEAEPLTIAVQPPRAGLLYNGPDWRTFYAQVRDSSESVYSIDRDDSAKRVALFRSHNFAF